MDVTALGGPHDGDTIAIDNGIRQIKFYVMAEPTYHSWLAEAKVGDRVDSEEVSYQVDHYYTGTDDEGGTGRMLMVVLAPDHWPKAGPDRPVYPPPEWRSR